MLAVNTGPGAAVGEVAEPWDRDADAAGADGGLAAGALARDLAGPIDVAGDALGAAEPPPHPVITMTGTRTASAATAIGRRTGSWRARRTARTDLMLDHRSGGRQRTQALAPDWGGFGHLCQYGTLIHPAPPATGDFQ